jgi:hypothetical protein
VGGKITIETSYHPTIKRYRASVVQDGRILYAAVRANREAAVHAAEQFVAYQVPA